MDVSVRALGAELLPDVPELTGRSLEDPRGLAELFVASEAVTLLGPSHPAG
jgi:hypothetical protein